MELRYQIFDLLNLELVVTVVNVDWARGHLHKDRFDWLNGLILRKLVLLISLYDSRSVYIL